MKTITLADLPALGDMKAANDFAHSFSGYREPFEEAGKRKQRVKNLILSNQPDKLTIDDLAESLFIHFRAVRHSGGEPNEDWVNTHLELMRQKLID